MVEKEGDGAQLSLGETMDRWAPDLIDSGGQHEGRHDHVRVRALPSPYHLGRPLELQDVSMGVGSAGA